MTDDRLYFRQLLAGRDMYELQGIRETVVTTMVWGLLLTGVLALGFLGYLNIRQARPEIAEARARGRSLQGRRMGKICRAGASR